MFRELVVLWLCEEALFRPSLVCSTEERVGDFFFTVDDHRHDAEIVWFSEVDDSDEVFAALWTGHRSPFDGDSDCSTGLYQHLVCLWECEPVIRIGDEDAHHFRSGV